MSMASTRSEDLIDRLSNKASWWISRADALDFEKKTDKAAVEKAWTLAAALEEELACLLEADGQEAEAAIHRVSAAGCYQRLGNFGRAITLLRAALSSDLVAPYRARVEKVLAKCLSLAKKSALRSARAMLAAASAS